MTNDEAFLIVSSAVDALRRGDQNYAAQTVSITLNALYLDKDVELWRDMDPIFAKWIALAKERTAENEGPQPEWPDIFD